MEAARKSRTRRWSAVGCKSTGVMARSHQPRRGAVLDGGVGWKVLCGLARAKATCRFVLATGQHWTRRWIAVGTAVQAEGCGCPRSSRAREQSWTVGCRKDCFGLGSAFVTIYGLDPLGVQGVMWTGMSKGCLPVWFLVRGQHWARRWIAVGATVQ